MTKLYEQYQNNKQMYQLFITDKLKDMNINSKFNLKGQIEDTYLL